MTDRARWAVAAAYLAFMAGLVYGVWDPSGAIDEPVAVAAALVLGIVHVAVGWTTASWYTLVLPVVAAVAAVPAGTPDGVGGEPLPIWVVLAYLVLPAGTALIGAGVVARRWPDRPAARD